ncbi:LysR family transcriptional regulator [Azotosporobacter soli]|uniref:LysR family transcriptional regulator n=1 Tax=Azotosporobacter soli TaxID=3055040 RepID=UPI0031FE9852
MDIRLLKTFLLVARLLNITRAAEQLSFSQPAITAQISNLEDVFKVALFERRGKRLALTEAGRNLVGYAERIVSLWEETQNAMTVFGHGGDSLRLGVSTQMINYYLPPVLRKIQSQLPELYLSVEVCMNTADVLTGVLEQRYDLGFIHGNNKLAQLQQHRIWRERVVWVAAAQWLENQDANQVISAYPLINYTENSVFRSLLQQAVEEEWQAHIEYSDSEALRQAVLAGLGVSYLPWTLVEDDIEAGRLVELVQGPALELEISLVHLRKKEFSVAIYALLLELAAAVDAPESLKALL